MITKTEKILLSERVRKIMEDSKKVVSPVEEEQDDKMDDPGLQQAIQMQSQAYIANQSRQTNNDEVDTKNEIVTRSAGSDQNMNRNAAINDGGLIVSDGLLQMDCQDVPNGTGEDLNAIEVSSITTDQQFQTVTETNDNYTFFDYSEVETNNNQIETVTTDKGLESNDPREQRDSDDANMEEETAADPADLSVSTFPQSNLAVALVTPTSRKNKKSRTKQGQGKKGKLSIITERLKCPYLGCKKLVKSEILLNEHLLVKHDVQPFRCLVSQCHGQVATSFTSKLQLHEHLEQVHGKLTKWPCKCTRNFEGYEELREHYWREHEEGQFTCAFNGCTFKSVTNRDKVHMHQFEHQRKYKCSHTNCSKSFKTVKDLEHHQYTHTGERPYVCTECEQSFSQVATLSTHLRIHRGDKCFHCTWPSCTYSSADRSNAIVHIRMVHFNLPATKKQQATVGIVDDRNARNYLRKR